MKVVENINKYYTQTEKKYNKRNKEKQIPKTD